MHIAKNIFISGANRGLGKELAKLLHQKTPNQAQIHISSRIPPQQLLQQLQLEVPNHHFQTYQMDINQPDSIADNVQLIKGKSVRFDTIVANAAVGVDFGLSIPSEDIARKTLATNVISTIDFIKQFIPLLSPNGRIVIVSAVLGAFNGQPKQLREKINNINITQNQIIEIANDYIASVVKRDMGYYNLSAYKTSKALLNSWSRYVLPTYLKEGQTQICLHPGWCKTDLGGKMAPLTAAQGAERINKGIQLQKVDHNKFYNQKFCQFTSCQ